jgi:hypothetical protein
MKTMMLAAAAVLTLGMSAAFADGGDGPIANTQFTELPRVVAQAQQDNSSAYAQSHAGNGTALFITSSRPVAHPFPWNPNEGVGG